MKKIINWSLIGIGLISILFWFLLDDNGSYSGTLLVISYILLIIILAAILLFSIINLLQHPKVLKRTLILLGASLVVIFICYSLTGDAPEGATQGESDFIETGLFIFYFLTAFAIGSMIFFGFKKTLKR